MDVAKCIGLFVLISITLSTLSSALSVHQACHSSLNPELCIESIKTLSLEVDDMAGLDTTMPVAAAVYLAQESVETLLESTKIRKKLARSSLSLKQSSAIDDCIELLHDASELIASSHSKLKSGPSEHEYFIHSLEDVHTWMSAALTYYTTCVDGFSSAYEAQGVLLHTEIEGEKRLSVSLASIAELRRQVSTNASYRESAALWDPKMVGNNTLIPNVTVAQDGTGQFTTISDALANATKKNTVKYVIYIKAGVYRESFEVPKIQNLVFMGDGIGKTIITGNKSVQDPNITTFTSATVAIKANDFIAQDITFRNTAGAENHQAVAVRISADKVAFFRCSFEGYQDTLYSHSLRQFFTECDIYGTVDFIFGNSAAVFQNCNLYARLPMVKQKNLYTAQGRTDPNQNTGFAFHNCNVDGVEELKRNISQYPTYLGRPWKEYSVTVFLKCYESSVVNPAGWLEWDGDFALKTLFYGEYFCYGAGAESSKRVNWSSLIYNFTFASQYTVASLINGNEWLTGTSLPFTLGL